VTPVKLIGTFERSAPTGPRDGYLYARTEGPTRAALAQSITAVAELAHEREGPVVVDDTSPRTTAQNGEFDGGVAGLGGGGGVSSRRGSSTS